MSLTSVVHNLANDCADELHFVHCQPVATSEVTRRAAWNDVPFYMRPVISNTVKTTGGGGCSAIGARLANDFHNFIGRKIAGVYFLIGLTKKNGAALIGFAVSVLSSPKDNALLWGKVCVSLFSTVTPLLSCSVALFTFISQTKRSARILQEDVRRGWQFLVASVANSMHRLCGYTSYPAHKIKFNLVRIDCQYGPH